MAQLLKGKDIAVSMHHEIKIAARKLIKQYNRAPLLCVIQAGEYHGSTLYMELQKKTAQSLSLGYRVEKFPKTVKKEKLYEVIQELNNDKTVNGIMLQLPLPGQMNANELRHHIRPEKDVEGVHPENLGKIILDKEGFAPCTACAVMKLLRSTKIHLYGKEAVVIGHSEIVGKPLSLMLMNALCTVTVCHIATGKRGILPEHVKRAEILVVAVGKHNLIKGEWIKEGAVVIDVGINCVGGKVAGDVEFETAQKRASFITPVPGGVGPVTVAVLMENLVKAAKKQMQGDY